MQNQGEYEGYTRILIFIGSIIALVDAFRSFVLLIINNPSNHYLFFHPVLDSVLLLILSLFLLFQSFLSGFIQFSDKILAIFGFLFLILGSIVAGALILIAALIFIFT